MRNSKDSSDQINNNSNTLLMYILLGEIVDIVQVFKCSNSIIIFYCNSSPDKGKCGFIVAPEMIT